MQEPAFAGVRRTRPVRVRVEEPVHVPAPVGRDARHRVSGGGEQPPQVLGPGHSAGVAAAHADDHDRVVRRGAGRPDSRGRLAVRPEDLRPDEPGQRRWGRIVEDECRGQSQTHDGVEPVTQIHGGQRVESEVREGLPGLDRVTRGVAQGRGDLDAYELEDACLLFGRLQPEKSACEGLRAVGACVGLPTVRHPDQAPQHQRSRLRT